MEMLNRIPSGQTFKRVALVVAKSRIGAAPLAAMSRFTQIVASQPGIDHATFAFTEQGLPALRDVLDALAPADIDELLVLPLLMPAEPAYRLFLARTISRWRADNNPQWSSVRIGAAPEDCAEFAEVLSAMLASCGTAAPLQADMKATTGSVVAAAKCRVLVCEGGPCHAVGAAALWGHLRNEQERLDLRNVGRGMMSAQTSCLGPCSLAPVVQVWPEGTVYGGVNEAALDRIIQFHVIDGVVVEEFAYPASGKKQTLRQENVGQSNVPAE